MKLIKLDKLCNCGVSFYLKEQKHPVDTHTQCIRGIIDASKLKIVKNEEL